jgi:NAD dependent epimerase/dehydratase family enzyme
MGNGRQWMSWILLADIVRAIRYLFEHDLRGAVNAVAPSPVTNATFTAALGKAIGRPAVLVLPSFALELAFGEMARATILQSQRATPARLLSAGFEFHEPEIDGALARAVASRGR